MLWDINIIPNELDNRYLMLPPGVLHMSALGRFGRFTLFSPRVSHSKHLPCSFCFVLCFGFGGVVALWCFCFLFCKCFGIPNSPRSLDLDDRQGFIASSAMQQKKKNRPHRLLEVTQGDICHVRATVLPPRINLPILAFCRRGWPLVRCVGTHNRVPLTDELQDCHHGFFVQITITRAIPTHAVDVTRWCSEAGQLMHLDYQYYAGDSHQFLVGIAHGLTLLASSLAPCWGDRESWDEWLLMELRHRYLALCGLAVHLHAVHASIGDLDACYDPGRTYMVAAPERPPCSLEEAVAVLYVRVRVEGFYDEGAVWCPAAIACGAMIEQVGLFVVSRAIRGRARMSNCYGMDCFGTYFTHVQTCDVSRSNCYGTDCFGTYFTHVQTCDVSRSNCYGMDCFGTYFTHVQTCDVTRVQTATEWTASVHTSHMSKPVM